jgi:hypothetical protein
MFDRLYETDFAVLYPMTIVLITGAAEVGAWLGGRSRRDAEEIPETGTLTGAALGLLALLLAFSFSLALSRYEARLNWVLEEANAISSTANFALMLPEWPRRSVRPGETGARYCPLPGAAEPAVAAGHSGDRGSTAIAADLSLRRLAERNEQYP